MRKIALLGVAALTACSGGGTSPSPIVARAPIAASSAPASTSSQTRATFVIQWPATTQAASTTKRRQTLSPSTQSISVSVNGGVATVVNKPTLSGSPSTTSVSIPAPPGSDAFTFIAWDQLGGTGAILDQTTATQTIVANANNALTVVLDGVCAALVPTIGATTPAPYSAYQNTSVPLAAGSLTVLQTARLIGPSPITFNFTRVDADGNTILTSAGTAPISVRESGTTPHVTIAPTAAGASNTSFTITPIVAEPDGASTTISATSPDCGSGTPTIPNSFQLSLAAEVVVAAPNGLVAFDQDGNTLAQLSKTATISGVAYNSKSNYLVAIESNSGKGIAFQTLSPTGSSIGSGTFTLSSTGNDVNAAAEAPGQIVYDPVNGNFFFTLQETSGSNVGGAIEEYSISGSTATAVKSLAVENPASSELVVDPVSIAVLSNGDIVSNDEDSTDESNGEAYTYEFSDALASVNLNPYMTTSLSFDSTRGYVAGFTPSTSSTEAGGVLINASFLSLSTFTIPDDELQNIPASAYNPGNDEFYLFDAISHAFALSGATAAAGGSTTSILSGNAFLGLYAPPTEAVVLP